MLFWKEVIVRKSLLEKHRLPQGPWLSITPRDVTRISLVLIKFRSSRKKIPRVIRIQDLLVASNRALAGSLFYSRLVYSQLTAFSAAFSMCVYKYTARSRGSMQVCSGRRDFQWIESTLRPGRLRRSRQSCDLISQRHALSLAKLNKYMHESIPSFSFSNANARLNYKISRAVVN